MTKQYKIDDKDRVEYIRELTSDCSKDMAVLDNFEDCLLYYTED